MNRVKMVLAVALLVCVLGAASSAVAASFTFADTDGQWWKGSVTGTLTISSDDLPTLQVTNYSSSGTGTVYGSLDSESWWPSYTLDASSGGGPTITSGWPGSVSDLGNNLYVAWNLSTYSFMLFAGDTVNGYAYFGIDFGNRSDMLAFFNIDKWSDLYGINWSTLFCSNCSDWSKTFTLTANADVIYGKNCNPTVPIPGAAWLLGSGLIGLVGIRKRFRKS